MVAVEFVGFEFHRRSFAVHGQIAVNGKQFFAVEIELGRYKTDFRVFVCIENIGRFQMLGKVVRTGLQFGQRQYDIDRALAFGTVKFQIAGQTINTADVGAGVEMVDGKAGIGMKFVHFINSGRRSRSQHGRTQCKHDFFHRLILKSVRSSLSYHFLMPTSFATEKDSVLS